MAPRIFFMLSVWDVKNGFVYVLQFFSLISDGLGGVDRKYIIWKLYNLVQLRCSMIVMQSVLKKIQVVT